MKVKGIKRGQAIELVEIINIPDGTEILIEIDDLQLISPKDLQREPGKFIHFPVDPEAIAELADTLASIEAEEREMLELFYGSRDEQFGDTSRSLVSFIGAAKGSFATPDEVDQFIRQERDAWES